MFQVISSDTFKVWENLIIYLVIHLGWPHWFNVLMKPYEQDDFHSHHVDPWVCFVYRVTQFYSTVFRPTIYSIVCSLGRYLKVKNEKWIYTIENNLNISWLSSFYVNNSKDRQTLYSIIDQVVTQGRKPTVHCSMFQDKVSIVYIFCFSANVLNSKVNVSRQDLSALI